MGMASTLLNAAPAWFQRDANRFGASVDLRESSGYKKLMGDAFFRFFRNPANCEGEEDGWDLPSGLLVERPGIQRAVQILSTTRRV